MPDWLVQSSANGEAIHLDVLAYRLVLAFLLGCSAAGVYWFSQRKDETPQWSFVATLVFLAILIAMVTQVIGNSVARAFSLVGALAIVRFRTVVEDTRDTAYVILAVVLGMAVGTGHVEVALVGLVVVAIAATLLRFCRPSHVRPRNAWELHVRIGTGYDAHELLEPMLREHFEGAHLVATGTTRQGAAIELTYRARLKNGATADKIVTSLNRVEGVQSVELRSLAN